MDTNYFDNDFYDEDYLNVANVKHLRNRMKRNNSSKRAPKFRIYDEYTPRVRTARVKSHRVKEPNINYDEESY